MLHHLLPLLLLLPLLVLLLLQQDLRQWQMLLLAQQKLGACRDPQGMMVPRLHQGLHAALTPMQMQMHVAMRAWCSCSSCMLGVRVHGAACPWRVCCKQGSS